MANSKPIDIQHNHVIVSAGETVPAGYVGLLAKVDGMYEKLPGEAERKLYNPGGGSTGIVIPKLQLRPFSYKVHEDIFPNEPFSFSDKLYIKWEALDIQFLDYNPEVWLFCYKNARKKKVVLNESVATIHEWKLKGWKHESHLKGVKYPNSKYYSGGGVSVIPKVDAYGRHTEFELSAPAIWSEIKVDVYEYVCAKDESSQYVDVTDLSLNNSYQAIGILKFRKNSAKYRFAIVIDNPDTNADNPKMIGPMSDVVALMLKKDFFGVRKIVWGYPTAYGGG